MPRNLILAALFLLTACGTATPGSSTPSRADLIPYLTSTPSPTLALAPEVIFADTPLATPTPFTYIVKAGDTMGAIAEKRKSKWCYNFRTGTETWILNGIRAKRK